MARTATKRAQQPVDVEIDLSTVAARPGAHISNDDAKKIAPRLFDLERRHGMLTAEAVLDDARAPDSPLHSYFEWDDSKAAEQHRLATARTLVRAIAYRVRAAGPASIANFQPALVHLSTTATDGTRTTGYVSVTRALADDDMRAQLLRRAHSDLDQWVRRYRTLEALASAMPLADRLLETVEKAAANDS